METTQTPNRQKKKKSNFIVQGGILAVAGIIVRMIGLLRRIPLTNIIGDAGNGYYSVAYEIYSIILIISSYSLPLAVSKLVSARVSRGHFKSADRMLKGALLFALTVGGLSCLLVFIFAGFLAGTVMLEPMSTLALQVLAPTLLIVAILGVYRGYFQGLGTMMPTAFSQILEQIILVIVSLSAASVMFGYGTKVAALLQNEQYAPAYGAAGGTLGCGAGALAALLFVLFVYRAQRRGFQRRLKKDMSQTIDSYGYTFKILIWTIVPVVLSTAVYNISSILDQYIYAHVMVAKGMEDVKTTIWGVYTGKYKVLTNVPIALANAMCASVVPTLTAAMVRENYRQVREKISMVIRVTMIVTIPCAVGLAVLGRPIVDMMFSGETALAAQLLQVGAVSVVFYSLSTLTNGILQGINRMKVPVRNSLIALAIHLAALYIMMQYMNLGIHAVVYSNIIFALLMCLLNGFAIRKHMKYEQEWMRTFVIPAASSAVMGLICFMLYKAFVTLTGNFPATIIAVVSGAIVYFILLIVLRGINQAELSALPGGKLLVRIAKFIRIM